MTSIALAHRRVLRRCLTVFALHAACLPAAMAQDVTWTGGAADGPYWDLVGNWSGTWGRDFEPGNYNYVGAPGTGLLGAFDTIVRKDVFGGGWQGTGTLTIRAMGEVQILRDSSFGTLVLEQGGALGTPSDPWSSNTVWGRVDIGRLDWQGGRLGGYAYSSSALDAYAARATLGGGLLGGGSRLTLTGDAAWQAGDSVLTLGHGAELRIAAGATLRDDTAGSRSIARVPYVYENFEYLGDYMKVTNEGTYLKSAGDTSIQTAIFKNTGLLKVTGGNLSVDAAVYYRNAEQSQKVMEAGRLDVSGGQLRLSADYVRTGPVTVTGGLLSLGGPSVSSTAAWLIDHDGTVQTGYGTFMDLRQLNSLRNDGLLRVRSGGTLELPQRVTGSGVVEIEGGRLRVTQAGQEIEGSLRMVTLPGTSDGTPELFFTVRGPSDYGSLDLGGAAELDGILTVNFADLAAPGNYLLLSALTGITGRFDQVRLTCGYSGAACALGGLGWSLGYDHGQLLLSISAVPEPGVLAMAALGLAVIAMRRLRGAA